MVLVLHAAERKKRAKGACDVRERVCVYVRVVDATQLRHDKTNDCWHLTSVRRVFRGPTTGACTRSPRQRLPSLDRLG